MDKKATVETGSANNIVFVEDSANSAVVKSGSGKNLIVSNNKGGHIYRYIEGQDTILGYNENDTIELLSSYTSYKTSITADGCLIRANNSSSNIILLKGRRKPGVLAGDTDINNYELLTGGTKFNINVSTGAINTTVPYEYLGTSGNDTLDATIADYKIKMLEGDDVITLGADNISLNTDAGNDSITVEKGANVIILAGTGNDLITIDDTSATGHVFQFATGDAALIQFSALAKVILSTLQILLRLNLLILKKPTVTNTSF